MRTRSTLGLIAAGLIVAAGGTSGALAAAGPASAHTPEVSCKSSTITVTLASYPAGSTVTGTLDGATLLDHVTFGPATYTASQPIDTKVEHTYSVVVVGSDGQGNRTFAGKTSELCGVPITPPVTTPPVTTPTPVVAPVLTVTPPTCNADGTIPFLTNPPAQNPNGYEFPGKGYRVYLSPAYAGPGTYTATIQKVGPGFDPAFPNGTKITSGATSQTLTVLPKIPAQSTDATGDCYVPPAPPEPVVVTPLPPTFTDECGTADDAYLVPANTHEIDYTSTATRDADGHLTFVTVSAAPTDGFTFANGETHLTWTHEFDTTACATTPVPPVTTEPTPPATDVPTNSPSATPIAGGVTTPAPVKAVTAPSVTPERTAPTTDALAFTGTDTAAVWTLGALGTAVILTGILLLVFRRRTLVGDDAADLAANGDEPTPGYRDLGNKGWGSRR